MKQALFFLGVIAGAVYANIIWLIVAIAPSDSVPLVVVAVVGGVAFCIVLAEVFASALKDKG